MDQPTSPTGASRRSPLRRALLAAVSLSLLLPASALAVVPDTTITSGPDGITIAQNTATFEFSSDPEGETFECQVDGIIEPFETCSKPFTTPTLDDGTYTFRVRAVDPDDGPDQDPAIHSFTVDTTPPNTTFDSGPGDGSTIADATPTFSFHSGDNTASFECRVDSDSFAACSNPHTTAALDDGPHTIRVRAVDPVGNADPDPAMRSFTVDTTPPGTTIDFGPTGTIADDTPTFAFESDDNGASFECSIDDPDNFAPCSGPGHTHTTTALADGPHTFRVRAVDGVGNADPTPASRSFTVDTSVPDTTGPDTFVSKRPKAKIKTAKKSVKVEIAFISEPDATSECRLDKAKYKACTSPYTVKAKSRGGKGKRHTISVRATDTVGNVGKPAVVAFKVLRNQRLQGSVARHTVVTALKRHDFARRVVKSVHVNCRRSSRTVFRCKFSGHFPGYRLKGRGEVKLRAKLSYRFRVRAQGLHFTLTDKNEARHRR
jgi:hypothetical protein